MASSLYQPSPRYHHFSVQVQEQSYLWGGCTQDPSRSEVIHILDAYIENWKQRSTTGDPPPGWYGASTLLCEDIYYYGGFDGKQFFNTLHKLQTRTLEWQEIPRNDPAGAPQPKAGCGMVAYQQQLALIGGYGPAPTGPLQSGAEFFKSTNNPSRGWTNEFHLFNVKEGKWSSPPTTGLRPPPNASFTFTAINEKKAVYFGGYRGVVNDVHIIDFTSMVWTRLEKPQGAPWPVGRFDHAACCLNYGDNHPVLLMTGGVDQNFNTLDDAWLLDVHSGRWKELTLPEGTQPRRRKGHTLTACNMEESRVHATTFGGSPSYGRNTSLEGDPKLAHTTVLEFESVQSGDDPSSRQWVLVGVADSSQLGSPERMEKLKQRKTEHVGSGNVEVKDQLIQTEIIETEHLQAENITSPTEIGSGKVEVKDQQIQTEIIETEHLQAENITSPTETAGTQTRSPGVLSPSSKSTPTGAISKEFSSEISNEMSGQADTKILDPYDLPFLMEQLRPVTSVWKFLGLLLKLAMWELNEIESMPLLIPGGPAAFLQEMLNRWLKRAPPSHQFPTLPKLCDALCTVGESRVAYDLEQQYQIQRRGGETERVRSTLV